MLLSSLACPVRCSVIVQFVKISFSILLIWGKQRRRRGKGWICRQCQSPRLEGFLLSTLQLDRQSGLKWVNHLYRYIDYGFSIGGIMKYCVVVVRCCVECLFALAWFWEIFSIYIKANHKENSLNWLLHWFFLYYEPLYIWNIESWLKETCSDWNWKLFIIHNDYFTNPFLWIYMSFVDYFANRRSPLKDRDGIGNSTVPIREVPN